MTDADLDRYCATSDVRLHLAALAAAGLDVAVLRDTGDADAAHELADVLARRHLQASLARCGAPHLLHPDGNAIACTLHDPR